MWFMFASILGELSTIILPLILVCLLQVLICYRAKKWSYVLPLLSFIYLIYKQAFYWILIWPMIAENRNVILFGIMRLIPHGSFLISTLLIRFLIIRIQKRKKNYERTKIEDL